MKTIFFLFLSLLAGCGGASETPSGTSLLLQINLPSGLLREARLRNFNQRVVMASVRFESTHGTLVEQTLPPSQWDTIAVPQLDFPKDDKDVLEVSIRIWDKNRDGFPRSYPVLTGHSHIKAQELNTGGPNTIPVRLSLAVSVTDYD